MKNYHKWQARGRLAEHIKASAWKTRGKFDEAVYALLPYLSKPYTRSTWKSSLYYICVRLLIPSSLYLVEDNALVHYNEACLLDPLSAAASAQQGHRDISHLHRANIAGCFQKCYVKQSNISFLLKGLRSSGSYVNNYGRARMIAPVSSLRGWLRRQNVQAPSSNSAPNFIHSALFMTGR